MISSGISKIAEYKNSSSYRATCCCMDSDHDQTLVVEHDPETNLVSLTIYENVYVTSYWSSYMDNKIAEKLVGWWKEITRRVKWAVQILTKGYVEAQGDFTFRGERAVRDYIAALEEGLQRMKEKDVTLD